MPTFDVDFSFRDFERVTPQHPAPIGDPQSGIYNPTKRDLRELGHASLDAAVQAQEAAEAATDAMTDVQGATMFAASRDALLANTASNIPAGAIFATRAEGYAYEVVTSNAHLTTAGGVKLYQIGIPNPHGRGAAGDGSTNDKTIIDTINVAANEIVDLSGKIYTYIGAFAPETAYINGTIVDDNGPWQFDDVPIYDRQLNDDPILIVATGQSNMFGGSGTTGGARDTLNNNVYMWEQFPGAGQTQGWKRAGPGSDGWPFGTVGNHIAYHYADMVQRQTGRTVLVVNQAVGGQAVAQWLPGGGGVPGATGSLYLSLNGSLVGARAAAIPGRKDGATLTSLGMTAGDILLWHQGEADADYRGTTGEQWKSRFLKVVKTFRDPAAEGSSADPFIRKDAPVLIGELLRGGTSGGNPTDDRNVEIAELDREEPLMASVSSDGLKSDDNLHFTGASLVEFARRYFERTQVMPKPMPEIQSTTRTDIMGKLTTVRGTLTVNAGLSAIAPLGVTMVDANFVPNIILTAHGSASPYMPIMTARTAQGFTLNNPGPDNMKVAWEVTHVRA